MIDSQNDSNSPQQTYLSISTSMVYQHLSGNGHKKEKKGECRYDISITS